MAQIINASIQGPISHNDQHSVMEFVVNYTASFSPNELSQEFEDAARLLEKDDNDNDQITPYQKPLTFIATGPTVDREFSIIVLSG